MISQSGGTNPMKTNASIIKNDLPESARQLALLTEALPGLLDIFDLLAGALYSLQMADRLGFRDRPGELKPKYKENLVKRLGRMGRHDLPSDGLWLAGLHFNSGIQRLGACYRRLQDVFKRYHRQFRSARGADFSTENLELVREESNKIKHDEYGLLAGRQVAFTVAVGGIDDLLSEVAQREPELRQKYS
jgi:hypothetical protein